MTATELGLSNLAMRERSFGRAREVTEGEVAAVLLAVLMVACLPLWFCMRCYGCFSNITATLNHLALPP